MTTFAITNTVAGLIIGIIALAGCFGMWKMRSKWTRKSLPAFVGQLALWTLIGVFLFSGVLLVIYYAAVAVIYVPIIVWILRLPKDQSVD
jgi:hypothetical protein